jgi:NADPH-dependent 2,4-dienoyl-CoA reductase/sulfur reductase-like enzyme
LSKGISANAPKPIRSEESLENNGIIVLRESNVTGIDYVNKNVSIEGKDPLSYDKLLIASGAKNRAPNIEGLSSVKYYSLRNK